VQSYNDASVTGLCRAKPYRGRRSNDIVAYSRGFGGMSDFFAELRRRHIYRVGAAYVVVAWVLTQGVATLAQVFMLPPWIAQTVIVLLAIGFPIALIATWAMEGRRFEAVVLAAHSKSTVVDWTLCGALALVLLLIGYQQLAAPSDTTGQQAGVDAARNAASSPASTISIAVLPFTNLSDDAQQQFFSDGMTEEITAALAKVPDLRVVARTSAFQFRDQNRDIQSIGQQLRATHFIEGSVRKAGERVRITVQLIDSADGTHVWSENYDRQLTDIFAIQEDIARTITTSLRMPLGLKPGENLVNNRSIDPQSYQLFLQAKALWNVAGQDNIADAARSFEEVITRNPNYAPGWAFLCATHFNIANDVVDLDPLTAEQRRAIQEHLQRAEDACRRAIVLDANFAPSYFGLGMIVSGMGRQLEGEQFFLKGLTLDPNDALLLVSYGLRLAVAGRPKEALPMLLKSHEIEPFSTQPAQQATNLLWLNGKDEEAVAQAKTLRPAARANILAKIYASEGRFGEAAAALMDSPNANAAMVRETIRLMRLGPGEDLASQSAVLRLEPGITGRVIGNRAIDFLFLKRAPEPVLDRILDNLESRMDAGVVGGEVNYIWHPAHAPLRKTERFKAFMRKAGYVEYWRAKGWPDLCRPVGTDDFVCN
jgi:adenylate cyclase